ncbi:unnamed protein product [Chondrus crispus]|uniref:Uncharacterized protein n=1 Tax=Chondrus crispus TaxID=2769 RepID=R7QIQ4_CHOCR|nr:unnamed protein product [Chondrus crispus]CDF37628.1 unnamed protein product [Chondrus crispus]|eukprot:XP_005717499.1 unnamed protein product [Chondrus crispus]
MKDVAGQVSCVVILFNWSAPKLDGKEMDPPKVHVRFPKRLSTPNVPAGRG